MLEHWKECKDKIIAERTKYEGLYDFFQDLSKDILKSNNIKVKQPIFKNNSDISLKVQFLQRIQRYILRGITEVNILEGDEFKILCKEYNLDNKLTVHCLNNKIFALVAYQEDHFKQVVQNLNSE